jgi:calcineurin-like phosphoesterase family protein
MIWFSADHHFGHHNIIQYCHRPFSGLEEMHEKLISNHNDYVKKGDTVYMLGDIVWHKDAGDKILSRLNGNLVFIGGGHDHRYFKQKDCPIRHIKVEGQEIYLCHFPLRSWPGQLHQAWHLHGHCHGNGPHDILYACDVGVDCWDYYPVGFDTLRRYFKDQEMNEYERR